MPTIEQLIAGYQELIDRAEVAGIAVILATVTPLGPELRTDSHREKLEKLRQELNDWIRTCGHEHIDFDAALRPKTDPTQLQAEYAAPDDMHPNIHGSKRLAQTTIDALARLQL